MHSRNSRHTRRNRDRLKKYLLAGERLEARQLLASDLGLETFLSTKQTNLSESQKQAAALEDRLATMAPTHFYEVDGQPVTMVINPAKLALKVAPGTAPQALSDLGLEFQRQIGTSYSLYESIDSSTLDRNQLLATGLVQDAVSVFFAQESRSDAVLLDEIIVALNPGVTAAAYFTNNPLFTSYQPLMGTPDQFIATVAAGTGEAALKVVNSIDNDPQLDFVAPNFYQSWTKAFTPNDPRFANQWHLHNTGQGGGLVDADVDMPEAWDVIAGNSPSFKIGIIDDSVASHPDLTRWVNPGEFPDGEDNDGNGWIDDMNGWNFVSNNSASGPTTADDVHGTAVAGVAAARGNNALGVAGAGYNASLISARIFEGTSVASDANIAGALYYMAGRTADGLGTWSSADIVNNSWSGGANSAAINAALTWGTTNGRMGRGTPYMFATGNGFGAVQQPALQSLNIPGVFAIGATNNKGTRSNYSNFGPAVDLVAPSNDTRAGYLAIDTTDRVGADGYDPSDYTGTGVNGFGGTSSATPLTVGVTSLVMARADSLGIVLTPADLRAYMRMQTDYLGGATFDPVTGKNLEYGFGRVNAFSAVSNLGRPEISVLSTTAETQSGGTLAVGSVYIEEFVDATFRIRNQGTQPLNLNSLNIGTGDFSLLSGLGATTLQIGQATTFTVRFSPTAGGARNQTVTITSNDADEGTFTFTLSGIGIVPTVSGMVFEDWDGDNALDPFDTILTNQVVFADTNNNGTFDVLPATFANTTTIPLVDSGVVTSTVTVSGVAAPIFDVNVRINATHTWASDLVITLISPTGTRVVLAGNVGADSDNFTNTVFDDEATTPIASAPAPRTGSFRPTQVLSAFDNEAANGTWTLEIEDVADFDTGSLLNWDVTISTAEPAAATRANGKYGILDLPVGSYTIRAATPAGWTSTTSYPIVVASPTNTFTGRDFGIGKNDRYYSFVFDDVDADGIWDSSEVAATGRMLLDDLNGNGTHDVTAPLTFTNSTPLTIPDNSTRTSTVAVSGITGLVTDVNVLVNFTMTFDADLDVFLIGPDGTRVELFTDVGGGGDNFVNTLLDDQATTSITAGTAPFTGSFRPEGLLANFNAKFGNGTWTLEVSDDAGGDVATLNNWSLIVSGGEVAFNVPNTGRLAMDMVVPGNQNVKLMPISGWRYTLPVDGVRPVNVAGTPITDQRFGTRLNNVAPTVNVPNTSISVPEGSALSNSGTYSDPNVTDTVTFTASSGVITASAGVWNWEFGSLTTDDTPSTIVTITADDGEGGVTSKTFTYTVTNVAPAVGATSSSVSGNALTTITNTGTWSDVAADTVTLSASLGTVVKNANGTWNWSLTPTTAFAPQTVTITASDEDGGSSTTSFTVASFASIPATNAYYKGSFYSAGGTNVQGALDTSKALLRAGAAATATSFANVTNYSKGINGVVVDITGLGASTLTAADFTFKMSPQGAFDEGANPPSSWATAPAPSSITVTAATPGPNSSRVKIEWPDNAIQDRWLQIRVLANANTGLQSPATYYLGNLRGDIDGAMVGGIFVLQNADLAAALPVGGLGSVTSLRDVDKNGFVLNSDFVIIRSGINAGLSLRAITIPSAGSPQEAASVPSTKADLKLASSGTPLIASIGSSILGQAEAPVARAGSGVMQTASSGMLAGGTSGSSPGTLKLATASAAPAVTVTKKTQAVDAVFEQLGNQL